MNLKKIYNDYKVELILEAVIIITLVLLVYLGNMHIHNIIDGTFVATLLSVPVAIVSYINTKKTDKNRIKEKLYFEELDRIIQLMDGNSPILSAEENSNIFDEYRDGNIIKIQLLQLDNIYEFGKNTIGEYKDRFLEITGSVALNLIFRGIKFERYQYYDDLILNIIQNKSVQLEKYFISVNQLLNDEKDKEYLNKFITDATSEKSIFSWNEELISRNEPPQKAKIFFNSKLVDFEPDDFEKYSSSIFIDPIFEYTKKNKKDILKTITNFNFNGSFIVNPRFSVNDCKLTYTEIKDNYNMLTNTAEIVVKYIFDNSIDRNKLKEKYVLNSKTTIRFSRTYPNDKYQFNSWFTIKQQIFEKFEFFKFAIVDDSKGTLILNFTKENFRKLLRKKSHNKSTGIYNFYFKIDLREYEDYINDGSALRTLYDTRVPKDDDRIEMILKPLSK